MSIADDEDNQDAQAPTPEQRKIIWAALQRKAEQYEAHRSPHLREKLVKEILQEILQDAAFIAYKRLPQSMKDPDLAKTIGADATQSILTKDRFSLLMQSKEFESRSHFRAYLYVMIRNKIEDYARKERWQDQPRDTHVEDEDDRPTLEPGQPSAHKNDVVREHGGGEQGEEFDLEKVLQLRALRHLMQTELNPKTELPPLLQDMYGGEATDEENAAKLGWPTRLYKTRLAAARAKLKKVYRDLPSHKDDEPPEETLA